MKMDFNLVLKGIDGKNIKDPDTGEDLTLAIVAARALLGNYQDEKDLPGEEKMRRFLLAKRILETNKDEEKAEFTIDEMALVKKLIAKAFPTIIAGQAWAMIEEGAK